jgi:drug/metabolite transporter (DMT)-like permease
MRSSLALVLVMASWGSAFASSKVAVGAVPHEVAAVLRFGIGALILLALQPVLGSRLSRRDAGLTAGLGMLGIFGYNVLFFLALTLAPSADGSVIVPATAPVITVAVTAMLGQRRMTRRTVVGLAAAVGGAAVFFFGIPAGGSGRVVGDLLFVAAATCWASYTICGAPVLRRLPAFTVTTYATVAGAIALAGFAISAFADTRWSTLDGGFWLNLAYLAVLPTALAYVLYYRAVHTAGPATAASAMFLVPVFGLACSWLLLGESITAIQATGAALMLVGAWLSTLTPSRKTSILMMWRRSLSTSPNSAAATGSAPSGQCPSSARTSAARR